MGRENEVRSYETKEMILFKSTEGVSIWQQNQLEELTKPDKPSTE